MKLDELKREIEAKVKGTHINILSKSEIASTKEWIPTPSYDLNRVLSGSIYKGLPNKTLTLFVGPETSGKSSFMCLCLAEAQRQGYTPIILDTEGAWDTEFVKRWNLDPDNLLHAYVPFVHQVTNILAKLIDTGEKKYAIVIDSIGGLERKKILADAEKGDIKADQGRLQKDIKQMLKMALVVCKSQESIALASGHYYGNPSTYGSPEEIGGGKYVKLAPDIIIALKKNKLYENPKGKTVAEKGKILGTDIKGITLKNRYYPPFNECSIEIDYLQGINRYAGLFQIALDNDYIVKNGSWFTVGDKKAQGEIKAMELLKHDDNFLDSLEELLKITKYSSVNEEIKEANEIIEDVEKIKKKNKK